MAKFPANPSWHSVYCDDLVSVYQNGNDDIHMKVKIKGGKTKQFYNETVYSDVPRFLADQTGYLKYWDLFN